ncbi:MAG: hypothetical protein AB7F19_05450 [Candidatus Babeliales bacterium]
MKEIRRFRTSNYLLVLVQIIFMLVPASYTYCMWQQPPVIQAGLPTQGALNELSHYATGASEPVVLPFQDHHTVVSLVTPSAPPEDSAFQVPARSHIADLLLAQEHRDERINLIGSLGKAHTISQMSQTIGVLLSCNFIKSAFLTAANRDLMFHIDPITITNLAVDFLLPLGALALSYQFQKRTQELEDMLIQLLGELDHPRAGTTELLTAEHRSHPTYTRYSSTQRHAPQTLTAEQEQQASDIRLILEDGSLDAKTQMYTALSVLFGLNLVKDYFMYNGQGYIPTITTALNGASCWISLFLALQTTEQQDEQDQMITDRLDGIDASSNIEEE